MLKYSVWIFIFLSGLIFGAHSMSVVNNVMVSSDFMQEVFLNEVRFKFNLSDIIGSDIIKARKCILQLRQIVNEFPSLKSVRFFDSWGKFPSGLLYGHLTDLGNYDQCVRTSLTFNESTEVVHGKYCLAAIPLSSESRDQISERDLSLLRGTSIDDKAIPSFIKIKLGICFPDTCDERLIAKVFQRALSNVLNGTFSGITVSQCSVAEKPPYEAADIFAIVLFSIIGLLMLLSTLYDWYMTFFERKTVQLFLAFSVTRNGRKLFMINSKKSPNTIDCLTGIRVFSMAWVLHCHNYMIFGGLNMINIIDVLSWYKKPWTLTVLMGTLSVDSFFFLSGLLLAWLCLRELDRTKGKLNVIMMWVHRYIRLTPPLAAGILFLVTLNKFIGSGPLKENYLAMHDPCKENWWATLLYVQNYATPTKMCFMQSWYLAIDTQLYFISPLILIPLWKWGRKFSPALVLLSLLSIGCIIATFIIEDYTSLFGFEEMNRSERIYFPTHTRYSVWLVGVSLGYFMHVNRHKALRPPKIVQLIGWIVCFGTIISVLFGPYFTINSSHSATVAEAALYESFKRIAWGFALAWIVFACHFGFGGLVNSFLSHPFWQPLGRLTYCLYLVHVAVATINFGTVRTDVFFSDYTLILTFWSNFGISLLVAIAFSLAFEAPILVIEKVIFGKEKSKTEPKNGALSSAPLETSIKV